MAGEIAASGGKDIIAVGGDGTFHEIINGIPDLSSVNIGFIPLGSGNDFASTAKLPKGNILKALDVILNHKIRQIDYIQFIGGLRCLNIAGTGLDIEVLKATLAMRRLKGKPMYLWGLIRVLKNFESYKLDVEIDGQKQSYECIIAGVCNGARFGGGMNLSPRSDLSDGLLNLVVIKMVARKRIKWLLPRFLFGNHIDMDITVHRLIKNAKISSPVPYKIELDGEIYSDVEFDCAVVPKGINMYSK